MLDSIQLQLCDVQGRLFELSGKYASEDFIRTFMTSETAEHLDSRYNKLQWMGEEYLLEELESEHALKETGEKYDREVLYWTGYIYRYWACSRGVTSRRIYKIAPAKVMRRNYPALHTLDPELAIDDLIQISSQNSKSRVTGAVVLM